MNVSRFGQAGEEYQVGLSVMLRAAKSKSSPAQTYLAISLSLSLCS